MNDDGRIQRLLACLGDPSRFRVLSLLVEHDCYVTEVAVRVGLSQSCTTRHLQALLREGVVHRVRAGKRVMFRIADSDPQVARLLEWAMLRASGAGGGDGVERLLAAVADARAESSPGGPPRAPAIPRSRLPVGVRRRPLATKEPQPADDPPRATLEVRPPTGRTGPDAKSQGEAARQSLDDDANLPPDEPRFGEGAEPAPDPSELEDYLL